MKGNLATLPVIRENPLISAVIEACQNTKAKDLTLLDIRDLSDMADTLLIASGRSDRQVQGIGQRVLAIAAESGLSPISIEGLDTGHWLLIDFGDLVVHIFYEPVRELYDLEGLWSKAARTVLDAA